MKTVLRSFKRKFSTKDGAPVASSPSRSAGSSSRGGGPAVNGEHKSMAPSSSQAAASSKSNGSSAASGGKKGDRKQKKKGGGTSGSGRNNGGGSGSGSARPTMPYPEHRFTKADLLTQMPSFRECIAAEKELLLIRKLKLCCVIFDFGDESSQENIGKEMKRQILLELVDYISTTKNWFSEAVLVAVIEMVSANLFRTLPPQSDVVYDQEEEEPVLDPAWSHLQIVYEFLLRFIVSTDTDAKLVKRSINGPFVLHLLELFASEDPRERDYLKTILHRVYGKFMSLRSFVRRSINNVFFRVIYEVERHNGVGELLEILGSIINGFALPLKPEHKRFLHNVLIPLHKVRTLSTFHQQLAYCISQFIDKDPKVSPAVIQGLLTYWPVTNSSKEVLFLNELEEVLELTQAEQFEDVMVPLFKRIALCIGSPHFQVAERALFLWNNEYIAMMTTDNFRAILPLLYPALHRNSKSHWNTTVHSLTFNIIKLFSDLDEPFFQNCRRNFERVEAFRASELRRRQGLWAGILKRAGSSAELGEKSGSSADTHTPTPMDAPASASTSDSTPASTSASSSSADTEAEGSPPTGASSAEGAPEKENVQSAAVSSAVNSSDDPEKSETLSSRSPERQRSSSVTSPKQLADTHAASTSSSQSTAPAQESPRKNSSTTSETSSKEISLGNSADSANSPNSSNSSSGSPRKPSLSLSEAKSSSPKLSPDPHLDPAAAAPGPTLSPEKSSVSSADARLLSPLNSDSKRSSASFEQLPPSSSSGDSSEVAIQNGRRPSVDKEREEEEVSGQLQAPEPVSSSSTRGSAASPKTAQISPLASSSTSPSATSKTVERKTTDEFSEKDADAAAADSSVASASDATSLPGTVAT